MRLLLINFSMDPASGALAWQPRIARALAARLERVVVLSENVNAQSVPSNLRVEALPAFYESRMRWWRELAGFNRWLVGLIKEEKIDACFIHMAHPWAYRLAPGLKITRTPVLMWYAHGSVTQGLRLAHALVDRVVTSTPEGFRIPSKKVRIIGQGVDTDLFQPPAERCIAPNLIHVGRISPRKRIDLLICMMAELALKAPQIPFRLQLVGPTLTEEDRDYQEKMRGLAGTLGVSERIEWVGAVDQTRLPELFRGSNMQINLSETGSMDKTVLEGLACGVPVLTANVAFNEFFSDRPEYFLQITHPGMVADQVLQLHLKITDGVADSMQDLRKLVVGTHDMDAYLKKIIIQLREISGEVHD